jgi:uncharacterized SAM-binding protein YcdF (DUF218 family)
MHYLNFVLIAALGGAAAALVLPQRRYSRPAAIACVALLFLWAWPPMARLTSATLEARYDTSRPPDTTGAGAIVVLSGSILLPNASRPEPMLGLNTFVRCSCAVEIYRRHPLPVLASGTWANYPGGHVSTGRVMRDFLVSQGASPVWIEDLSKTTGESAAHAAQMLQAKGISRIVLVTEGYHMPRSEASFRKAGFSVVPAPCSFNSLEPLGVLSLFPDYRAVQVNENNFHEWVGLLLYRLRGEQ